MIPYDTITAWGVSHPWPSREQIEQDLLLSKAIIEIYKNETLAGELIFRGGTALHKMILPQPSRYSEDLDFVRTSAGAAVPQDTITAAINNDASATTAAAIAIAAKT